MIIADHIMKDAFAYAGRNGFEGTKEEYVQLNYAGYLRICKRCDVTNPKTIEEWLIAIEPNYPR